MDHKFNMLKYDPAFREIQTDLREGFSGMRQGFRDTQREFRSTQRDSWQSIAKKSE